MEQSRHGMLLTWMSQEAWPRIAYVYKHAHNYGADYCKEHSSLVRGYLAYGVISAHMERTCVYRHGWSPEAGVCQCWPIMYHRGDRDICGGRWRHQKYWGP